MIIKILEYDFMGFHLVLDEEDGGWNCVIGTEEIKFPTVAAAEASIMLMLAGREKIIKRNGGVVIRKVPIEKITKAIEDNIPY